MGRMEQQLNELKKHVRTVNTEVEQVREGEKESGNKLMQLQQQLEERKREQERLVKENEAKLVQTL